MARNEEKQYGRLNRLILQKEKDEHSKLYPKRPNLSSLRTVDEIKTWLPSIKKDIDFNLKQSQVVCYSDRKISELQENVVRLEREYKRFVRKIKDLDSELTSVPWTDRPYESKRTKLSSCEERLAINPIETPILDKDLTVIETPLVLNCDRELQDVPLRFKEKKETEKTKRGLNHYESVCLLGSSSSSSSSLVKVMTTNLDGIKRNPLNLDYSDSESD